jgi:hypothetical protein
MRRACRILVAALLVVPLALSASCEKEQKSNNADLKVPDVPPAGSGNPKQGPAGSPTGNPK